MRKCNSMKESHYVSFILFYTALYRKGFKRTSRLFYWLNRFVFSCDIPGSVKIGHGLVLPHMGLGVVLHPNTIIKNNVRIYQNVTIGSRYRTASFVTVGDGTTLGAGCKIMGGELPLTIAKEVSVGANAVVLSSVPDGATAVGVPAKIIIH